MSGVRQSYIKAFKDLVVQATMSVEVGLVSSMHLNPAARQTFTPRKTLLVAAVLPHRITDTRRERFPLQLPGVGSPLPLVLNF